MSPPPTNTAAYLPSKRSPSLTIKEAPYPSLPLPAGHILIRTAAVAINPLDWLLQSRGDFVYPHLKYPCVIGVDVAGEVVSVSPSTTRFKAGDRVVGCARGTEAVVNESAQGAFQRYVVLQEGMACPLPAGVEFRDASVIPLAAITAATALFDKTQLNLSKPTAPPRKATGETVVIWGASTSVGCMAVQLAVAAGYTVVATCSPRNFEMVRRLGASEVFDYASERDIAASLKGRVVRGAVSIGPGSAEKCLAVLRGVPGSDKKNNKFIAMVSFPVTPDVIDRSSMLSVMPAMAGAMASLKLKGALYGVSSAFTSVSMDLGKFLFSEYLPGALREGGGLVAAPEAMVVGHGLESLQEAFEVQKKGVSGKKVVVTL